MKERFNGMHRIACAVPRLVLGDPAANADEIIRLYNEAADNDAAIVLTPELSLTGASCGDLFWDDTLLEATKAALRKVVKATDGLRVLLVVGFPARIRSKMFNCAALVQAGDIIGITASSVTTRVFSPVSEYDGSEFLADGDPRLITRQPLFDCSFGKLLGIEFGEESTLPVPPSVKFAEHGAQIVLCMASFNETANSGESLRTRLKATSERLKAVYALASAGVHESTADTVCAGHAMVAMEGEIAAENTPFSRESNICYCDCIPSWSDAARRNLHSSYSEYDAPQKLELPYLLTCPKSPDHLPLRRLPFVPDDKARLAELCENALAIQSSALAKRVEVTHSKKLVLGISGGLDSTLALLVCARCCDMLDMLRSSILAITMPGMGTSSRTKSNAHGIMKEIGAETREISIKDAVLQHFKDIGHSPDNLNVVYENAQARERTQILMDIANGEAGLLVGTGDLSETAMGWCTFNGDHISMYNVNGSIPKTLMRKIIAHIASKSPKKLAEHLKDIVDTPVSPELLPGAQHTEDIIGNYDLHDFFLYHFIRHSTPKELLLELACHAFKGVYTRKKITATLEVFIKRFITQQFKRNVMSDGPMVTEISLSPRGAWQMPSDISFTTWK